MRGCCRCSVVAIGCGLALTAAAATAAPADDRQLIEAVKRRDVAAVRELLTPRRPAVDVNAAAGDGATALHWAAHRDDLTIADGLASVATARPSRSTTITSSPLSRPLSRPEIVTAMCCASSRIEKLLLVAGVQPSAASSRPVSAITRAQAARATGS